MKNSSNSFSLGNGKRVRSLLFPLGLLFLLCSIIVFFPVTLSAQEDEVTLSKEKMEKIRSIESDDYVYIFCNPLTDLRVKKLIQGAKITGKRFDLSAKFFGPSTPYDAEEVLKILKEIIAQSPNGIAMEVGHPSKFDRAIGRAVEKGILFISFSVDDWTANPRQGYVGYNWQREGKRLADALFGELLPTSEVIILDSATKKERSCHARMRGITDRINDYNLNYVILEVEPEKESVKRTLLAYLKDHEADGIVSLWGEITKPLAAVVKENDLGSIETGGFGCGDFVKFVQEGSLDVLMKVITQLEGGIPLEDLHYSHIYGVIPSSVTLHAKVVTGE